VRHAHEWRWLRVRAHSARYAECTNVVWFDLEITRDDLVHAVQRVNLRGLLIERKQGATLDDYVLPERAYTANPNVKLPHFITPEFWQELRQRVLAAFDAQITQYGLQ
jgi:hypothetical protein